MTHAVLVATTRMLFGKFYESLARGRGIAAAIDNARAWLANNPGKYKVRREPYNFDVTAPPEAKSCVLRAYAPAACFSSEPIAFSYRKLDI